MSLVLKALLVVLVVLALWVLYDILQRRHAILHNFPILGHFRYWLEAVGPELRQYIVTSNDEERPFSRDQRTWVYTSAKKLNNYFGFGTDNELELSPHYLVLRHAAFPVVVPHPTKEGASDSAAGPSYPIETLKVCGAARGRAKAFRLPSIVNISAMSFGSLSGRAVEALNRGASIAHCLQNTGEGGVSSHHLEGGELVWQIGTGYFGCRDERGRFDMSRFLDVVAQHPVRAIEIKLSQGAKPGLGGVLPGAKVSPEIAAVRGIPVGRDCLSPPGHSAFSDVSSLLDFVEELAAASGLPIGIKSAVGERRFWQELAEHMEDPGRGVDFITIDGAEGGTGAGPLAFTDHVALPFKLGMSQVYRIFAERGLTDRLLFFGSGKLGFPHAALLALALGCDAVQVAREAMMAVGCIQAQRCHTGRCPTGVATQNRWLVRGLDPTDKAARLANYIVTLRKEILQLSHACGASHPNEVSLDQFEVIDDRLGSKSAREVFGYEPDWGPPRPA